MVAVEILLATIVGFGVLLYAVLALLLRENRALTRALIARTPKELTMLEKVTEPSRSGFRRVAPHKEAEFPEPPTRAMGL